MPTESELRQQLADVCRVLFRLHLVDYMGHPSVRVPGTDLVLIKPRHSEHIRAQDRIRPEDMATIALDGTHVAGPFAPPGERFIHTEIYRARSEVQAVVHTHQAMATAMSIGGVPILPVLHVEGELVEQPVPLWPHGVLVSTRELGASLAASLGGHRVALMQGHGNVSAAASLPEAALQAIHLERLAEANWRVRAMGVEPRPIAADELRQRASAGVDWPVRWAYYRQMAGCDEE
jgi:ribulose-5-phosphate 4-epimerase/fuculose-1-phosphate aldolase